VDVSSGALPRNRLERWILTYLGTRDLEMQGSGRAYVDVRTISKLIPAEIFPEIETEADIWETLREMEKRDLIAEWAGARYADETTFIIKSTGIIQFRKQIQPIVNAASKQETYEEMIEQTPGDPSIKKEFKMMWIKLKDKTEDEIIQTIVKGGAEFRHQGSN
jgi:hypothetical protein